MEISEFLDSKGAKEDIDQVLKEKIKSKQHRGLIKKVLEVNPNKKSLLEYMINGYNDFVDHKALMKNNNILFEDFFKDKNIKPLKAFEAFNDSVQKAILHNNANKLKKRIISKKYEHLCNLETDKLFLEMATMEFTKKELQDFIGKKISAFHYPIEFNGALMNLIDIKESWEPEKIISKLAARCNEGKDYSIAHNEDNILIVDIHSFEASKLVGSKMWCITREKQMYDSYKDSQHIDYKYVFDFNQEASNDLSMVALLTDLEGGIHEIYSKADEELSKNKPLRKRHQDLINSVYEGEYTFEDMIEKLQYNKEYENNSMYRQKFNPNNESHHMDLLENLSDYNRVITKQEMEKRPDLFDVSEMTTDDFSLIRDSDFANHIAHEIRYMDEANSFFNKKQFSRETIDLFFSIPEVKAVFEKNWFSYFNHLLENGKNEEFLSVLEDDGFINKVKERASEYGKLEDYNLFSKIIKNNELFSYLEDNNKLKDIQKLFEKITEGDLKNEEIIYDTMLIKLSSDKEYDNFKKMFPKAIEYKCDFSNADYTKSLYYRRLNKTPESALEAFDFSKDKKMILETISKHLLEDIIQKSYNHPKDNFKEFEDGYEKIFKVLKSLDDKEPENEVSEQFRALFGDVPRKNIFNGIFSERKLAEAFSNIHVYDLTKDKENSASAMFNVLKNISNLCEFENGICTKMLLRPIMNRFIVTPDDTVSDELKEGIVTLVSELHKDGLLDNTNLIERYECHPILTIAKETISKIENPNNKLKSNKIK